MKRFVIIAPARSGSTLLSSALAAHPDIECKAEVLDKNSEYINNPYKFGNVYKYLDLCYQTDKSNSGYKILYSQWAKIPDVKEYFQDKKDIYIIHLFRDNLFESYISLLRSQRSGVWNVSKNKEIEHTNEMITVEPWKCLEYFNKTLEQKKEIDNILNKHKILQLTYLGLCNNYRNCLDLIYNFLDVKIIQPPEKATQRLEQLTMHSRVENYQLLKERFRETKYAPYFT